MRLLSLLIPILIVGLMVAGMWKVFQKAGQPGWWALLPVMNALGLIRSAAEPNMLIWFLLIPVVNLFVLVYLILKLAQRFKKGWIFGLGLLLLPFVFFPVLGFGDSECKPGNT